MSTASAPTTTPRLYRSTRDKKVAGVCGGIAESFGWDPTAVRLIAALSIVLPGPQVIAYLIAWIVMPTDAKVFGWPTPAPPSGPMPPPGSYTPPNAYSAPSAGTPTAPSMPNPPAGAHDTGPTTGPAATGSASTVMAVAQDDSATITDDVDDTPGA